MLPPHGSRQAVPERQPGHCTPLSRRLEVGRKLGNGRFGRVMVVRDRLTGMVFALKTMKKQELVANRAEISFKREVENQARLDHPNVLKIYGYYATRNTVNIIVEFSPRGELYGILSRDGPMCPALASKYIAQVSAGLDYCHKHHILHRDIKPENLLLGVDGQVKIADFGGSVMSKHQRRTFCGTLDYMAPEVTVSSAYDHTVDTWAVGVLTYEFLTGKTIFYHKSRSCTIKLIKEARLTFPESMEPEAQDFIQALLQKIPEDRMALSKVPAHPWMLKHRMATHGDH